MPFPCVTAVALHLMDMLDESTSRVGLVPLNCKIRHLRREALLGCSVFLELRALTFCEARAIPVSE